MVYFIDAPFILWLDDILEPPTGENVLWCRWDLPAIDVIAANNPVIKIIDMSDNFLPFIEWLIENGIAQHFEYNIHSCNIDKTNERKIAELLKPYNVKLTFNPPSKIIRIDNNDLGPRIDLI